MLADVVETPSTRMQRPLLAIGITIGADENVMPKGTLTTALFV
jgi:hypothetical protein